MTKNLVGKVLFVLLILASLFFTPAIALFVGILFSLIIGNPYPKLAKKASKYM